MRCPVYKCPVCKFDFSVNFDKQETKQGGKNDYCPQCGWLLWVPIRGDPMPIPIPLYSVCCSKI